MRLLQSIFFLVLFLQNNRIDAGGPRPAYSKAANSSVKTPWNAATLTAVLVVVLACVGLTVGGYWLLNSASHQTRLFPITSYPVLLSLANPAAKQTVPVNFKVYLKPTEQTVKPAYVELQQHQGPAYILNDAGNNGDFAADDNVYGAIVKLDTSQLNPEDCLRFTALVDKNHNIESPAYSLCVSGLPTRVAASNFNKANRVDIDDHGVAIADELLLKFESGVSEREIKFLADEIGAQIVGQLPAQRLHQFKLVQPLSADALMALAANLSDRKPVVSASPNLVVTNAVAPSDAEYVAGNQHGLEKIFTDPVSSRTLWDVPGTTGGSSIFVLDSGVDYNHEDLSGINLSCVDFNDLPAAIGPCVAGDEDSAVSSNGHGMRIIGTIAAQRDNPGTPVGIAGVVSASPVISVKSVNAAVQAENTQGMDTIAGAIESLAATAFLPASNPVVVNFSRNLGGGAALPVLQPFCAAVNNVVNGGGTPGLDRPALVINSAGNNNSELSGANTWPVQCKISSVDPNNASSHFEDANNDLLIIVGNSVSCAGGGVCADGTDDTRYADASFGSNYGSLLDVFAPGTSVITPDTTGVTGYSAATGTSLSAPLVAGAAALMMDCGVQITSVNTLLKSSAPVSIPFPGGSAGRINVFSALKAFTETTHGPMLLTYSYPQDSNEISIGAHVNTTVADLVLLNSLGACNEVSYSVPAAHPYLVANGSRLVVKHGADLALGPFTITVTAEDAYGRTANVMLNFTVVSQLPPASDNNSSGGGASLWLLCIGIIALLLRQRWT